MRICATALLGCLLTAAAALEVGDPAPGLDGVEWVKGEAPTLGEQVTVVEFWATWCGPCLQSIPHLTELQHEYGDRVAIVGLSDEELDIIEPFVEERGAEMDYAVGRLTGEAREAWMAGVRGIPHAFIVGKEGTVLWKGHPMTMDRPLEAIVEGRFDPEQAKRVGQKEEALQASFQSRDMAQIKAAALDLLAIEPTHQQALYVLAGVSQQEGEIEDYRAFFAGLDPAQLAPADAALIADLLLSSQEPRFRLLETALPLAERASSAEDDAEAVAVWAKARYLLGDLPGAIAHAERAVELAPEDEDLAGTLAYYRLAAELGSD